MTSLQSHILDEEARYPSASGDFTWILSALSLAAKAIAAKVRHARIEDVLGDHGGANVHGETQQKLDVIANDILMTCLGNRPHRRRRRVRGRRRADDSSPRRRWREVLRGLRSARRLVESRRLASASGRSFRSCATTRRVAGAGRDAVPARQRNRWRPATSSTDRRRCSCSRPATASTCSCSTPSIGSFVLVKRQMRIPERQGCYSVNEANRRDVPRRLSAGISTGRTPTAIRAATSARWSLTCIARCSRAACSSIRRPARIRRASCD